MMSDEEKKKQVIGLYGEMLLAMILHKKDGKFTGLILTRA
jgi:hypothetical protein